MRLNPSYSAIMKTLPLVLVLQQLCASSSGIFDTFPVSLICICAVIGFILFLGWKSDLLKKAYRKLSAFIQRYSAMPDLSRDEILPLFWRMIRSNWYTVLLIVILWILLFEVDAGSDLVVSYVDEIATGRLPSLGSFGSLYLLFCVTLLMTLSIWTVPFHLFSGDRIREIKKSDRNALHFYVGLRILSLLAISPFVIIANSFFFRFKIQDTSFWEILLVNIGIFALLTTVETLVFNNTRIKNRLGTASDTLVQLLKTYVIANSYFVILIQLLLIECIYVVVAGVLALFVPGTHYLIGIFILLSGATVFRMLFFTDGKKMDAVDIWGRVSQLTGAANSKSNKRFYNALFWTLGLTNILFFLMPSLSEINTIYVVLAVFGFLIIYVDLCRYWTASDSVPKKIAGYLGILIFLIAPNISPKGQFSVPLQKLEIRTRSGSTCSEKMGKGLGPVAKDRLLDSALARRIRYISQIDTTQLSTIYVVCAMGGGSRAGYFTASVLQSIADSLPDFWDHTLLYSTISGGSVGTYHYIKRKVEGEKADPAYLQEIYRRNYNTSGMFGLLLGDAFEGAFGGFIGRAKKYLKIDPVTAPPYRDRNVRIRQEYELSLRAALSGKPSTINSKFKNLTGGKTPIPDRFQSFAYDQKDAIPIHLVNTFEINTGRRTVLSPYVVDDTTIFSNAILPLQDTAFSKFIANQDISYREAVNMSELFPFLSAASTIGDNSDYQFVDGGYFENYGLATAFDVIHQLKSHHKELTNRLKVILIKNSLQPPTLKKKTRQLIAPLVGVINAPFTGHANHFQEEGRKMFCDRFVVLELNEKADTSRVSLTRALTKRHMDIMDKQAAREVRAKLKKIRYPYRPCEK